MTTVEVSKYQEHIRCLNDAVTSNLSLLDGLTAEKLTAIIEIYENLLKKVLDIDD
jgi:hypothetical protein